MKNKLYLIPNAINGEPQEAIPSLVGPVIEKVRHFMVERQASAEKLLKRLNPQFPIKECVFFELSEHTPFQEAKKFFEGNLNYDIGIISEAGVPCVADPGAEIVALAHAKNIEVVPLVGPSSILLALMGSGFNGQNFAFNGYLPKEKDERIKKLKELERRVFAENQTQIFMEAPYRNQNLFEEALLNLNPKTALCVAADLTMPTQFIKTLSINEWKKNKPAFDKRPALFLIGR